MIHADTDGLLDKCHCGAVAGFEESELGAHYRARCTECYEHTAWTRSKFDAVVKWNTERRKEKE